uniref:STEAP family member 4 n=1 Tax=Xiphophorus couchianus TaxID=32473 RepID=A0A3B5MPQ6_9TELE
MTGQYLTWTIGKSEEMKQNGISLHPLDMAAASEPELLCIFGPRDLGRSLGLRLLQSGYGVTYGSRRPHSCGPLLQGAQVMTHAEAVLVDLSNNLKKGIYTQKPTLNSCQQHLPNTFPSVFLCGESEEAKQAVAHLASKLGLTVLVKGSLSAELEDLPLKLFPEWRLPLSIAVGLTSFFFFYLLIRDVIHAHVENKDEISYRIMVSLANKLCPIVALVMLSLRYLPGVIEQMGLVALGYAFLHAIYTFIIPICYSVRHKLISGVVDEVHPPFYFDNTEAGATVSFISLGILGFFLFVLLGLTSLPSVGGSLSWREFNFIQSELGHLTLFICMAHCYIYGWNKFLQPSTCKWYTPPGYMLYLIVSSVVLVLKLLLLLPCVDRTPTQIRQGWEQTQPKKTHWFCLLPGWLPGWLPASSPGQKSV